MRIIALMNQKGGVGKTTTTVNLGAALAELGNRVCLIDMDPQAHLTINYGVDPSPEQCSLYDVLVEDKSFLEAVHKINDRIALVPSSIDLVGAEIELVSVLGRETILKRRIEAAQHDFEYILIDCPPSLGLLTLNALAVATEVIIPMQPHFLALQGVAKLLETVQLVSRRMNPALKVSGIVLTMFDAQTKLSTEVVGELNGFIEAAKGKPLPWADAKVFQTKIRRNIKLAESPSFGQTILDYESASNGAADYRALAREVAGAAAQPAPVKTLAKPPVRVEATVSRAQPSAARQATVSERPVVVLDKPVAFSDKPIAGPPPAPVMDQSSVVPNVAATAAPSANTTVTRQAATIVSPSVAAPTSAPLPLPPLSATTPSASAKPAPSLQRAPLLAAAIARPRPAPSVSPASVTPVRAAGQGTAPTRPAAAPGATSAAPTATINPGIDQSKLVAAKVTAVRKPASLPPSGSQAGPSSSPADAEAVA